MREGLENRICSYEKRIEDLCCDLSSETDCYGVKMHIDTHDIVNRFNEIFEFLRSQNGPNGKHKYLVGGIYDGIMEQYGGEYNDEA